MGRQQGEQPELLRPKVDHLVPPPELVRDDVQLEAVPDRVHRPGPGPVARLGIEPGQTPRQLRDGHRRGERVIEPSLERSKPCRDRVGRGEMDRPHVRPPPALGCDGIENRPVGRWLRAHDDPGSSSASSMARKRAGSAMTRTPPPAVSVGSSVAGPSTARTSHGHARRRHGRRDEGGGPAMTGLRRYDHDASVGRLRQRDIRYALTIGERPENGGPRPGARRSAHVRQTVGSTDASVGGDFSEERGDGEGRRSGGRDRTLRDSRVHGRCAREGRAEGSQGREEGGEARAGAR